MKIFKIERLLLLTLLLPFSAEAKVIQILHTNDLHASLNTSGAVPNGMTKFGGWAQVKTVLDRLTAEAKSKEIETVRLDAGDFFEGTLSYFPDRGVNVLRAYQNLGYDAVTLGNHDWLMGAVNTDASFGKVPFPFPVLSSNIEFSNDLKNLRQQIKPVTQIIKDGIKIGVVGVSTDEIFYRWITKVGSGKSQMKILDYRDSQDPRSGETISGIANRRAAELRQNNDLVIALTHIGFSEDQKLAQSSSNIDLIVGGHSHTILESLAIVDNTRGEPVSIVQSGVAGAAIGKILVDVVPGKKPEVLSYELVPVFNDEKQDQKLASLVAESEKRIEDLYGPQLLNEVVGYSEDDLISGSGGKTAYSKFVVDAMKETTQADLALDMGEFHSNSPQEHGDVTRRKLMEMYPRKLNAGRNQGLYVYHFEIPGWMLKTALKLSVKFGYALSLSGVEFQTQQASKEEYEAEKAKLGNTWKGLALTRERVQDDTILINGKKLRLFRRYTVATPEFIVRGAYAISFLTRLALLNGRQTDTTIWEASKQHLQKIGVIPGMGMSAKNIKPYRPYRYSRELLDEFLRSISTMGL